MKQTEVIQETSSVPTVKSFENFVKSEILKMVALKSSNGLKYAQFPLFLLKSLLASFKL